MKTVQNPLWYFLIVVALALTGCNGDGDSAAPETEATPEAIPEQGDDGDGEPTPEAEEHGDGDEQDEPATDLGTVRVVASIAQTFEFLPAELGKELGVWERRGLTPENLYVEGSGQAGQTMAAGEADIALEGGASGIAAILAGLESRFIGEIGREFNMMVIVAPLDSDIEGPEDLRGKTVGITSAGSLTDYVATSVARTQGWDESEIEKATVGGLSEQLAALQSGATDAFVWSAEAGYQLEEEGTGRVVVNAGDIIENNLYEAFTARVDVIENEPEKVQAYMEGWYETVQWMKDNRDETVAFCVQEFELSEYVCENTYDLDMDNMSTDGVIPEENLQGLAQSVVERGIEDEAPDIDEFYDGRFVPVNIE